MNLNLIIKLFRLFSNPNRNYKIIPIDSDDTKLL